MATPTLRGNVWGEHLEQSIEYWDENVVDSTVRGRVFQSPIRLIQD